MTKTGIKALLVGGHNGKNDVWVRKAKDRLGFDIVKRWEADSGRKSPPGGKYEVVLLMIDVMDHTQSDLAVSHAKTEGLPLYRVSKSMTKTIELLEEQGYLLGEKVKQAVHRDESRRRRRWTDSECIAMHEMFESGKTAEEVAKAMSSTPRKCRETLAYRKKVKPELFGLPPVGPVVPAKDLEKTEAEWEELAAEYELERDEAQGQLRKAQADLAECLRERDEARGALGKAKTQISELHERLRQQAVDIGIGKRAEEIVEAMAHSWGLVAERLEIPLSDDILNVDESDDARKILGTQIPRLVIREFAALADELWQVRKERDEALVARPAVESGPFNSDAFQAGASAALRALAGDRTVLVLLELAGYKDLITEARERTCQAG